MSDWNSDTSFYVTLPYYSQQQREEYEQDCERQDRIMEAQMREVEEQCFQEMKREQELAEDRKKYPLFFLKEGIV